MGKTKDCCKLFISKYLWDPCSWQNSKMAPMNIALRVTPAVILPKEGWAPKNWCFQTVVLEKTLESPLNCKVIKPVNPNRNQSWIFTGGTDAEAEIPLLWPPNVKSWLIGKDPDAGKDRWQEEKGVIEVEMVGWLHWFNGHEFEQVPGDGEGQGSLACCSPCGCKEFDMT